MPKKLTVLGVLAALALGAFGLLGDSGTTHAGPGGPVQNFVVNADTCYGTAPLAGAVCSPGTNTVSAAGETDSYNVATIAYGSRLTTPLTYIPNVFTLEPSLDDDEDTVGDITAKVDIFCDSGPGSDDDILSDDSAGAGTVASWPATWTGETFTFETDHLTDGFAYIDLIKPFPADFDHNSFANAELERLYAFGTTAISITAVTGTTTPLSLLTESVDYPEDGSDPPFNVSWASLGGEPAPPGGVLCLDSPQDSSAHLLNSVSPAANLLYPRFTVYTSAIDLRTWTVSRMIDLQCVRVGAAIADADGDCWDDAADTNETVGPAGFDQDGDLVSDGIEVGMGSNPNDPDSDDDGANDFTELVQLTDPNDVDTDGDGHWDEPEDGTDEGAGKDDIEDAAAGAGSDDNCPSIANAGQENTDTPLVNVPNASQPIDNDASDPMQDTQGDACDADNDGDGISDVAEDEMWYDASPVAGESFCAEPGTAGYADAGLVLGVADLDEDIDNDGGLDGRECSFLKDPLVPTSRFLSSEGAPDQLPDGEETNYRTQGINHPDTSTASGAAETDCDDMLDDDGDSVADDGCAYDTETSETADLDGDTVGSACVSGTAAGTGAADTDADCDAVLDGVEVKFILSTPSSDDSDGDGCYDGYEVADINGNRVVNVIDLGQIAAVNPDNITSGGVRDQTAVNRDLNKSGTVDVIDLGFAAARAASLSSAGCAQQAGVVVTNHNDGDAP